MRRSTTVASYVAHKRELCICKAAGDVLNIFLDCVLYLQYNISGRARIYTVNKKVVSCNCSSSWWTEQKARCLSGLYTLVFQ